jgi:hypothetical protein
VIANNTGNRDFKGLGPLFNKGRVHTDLETALSFNGGSINYIKDPKGKKYNNMVLRFKTQHHETRKKFATNSYFSLRFIWSLRTRARAQPLPPVNPKHGRSNVVHMVFCPCAKGVFFWLLYF